MMGLALATLAKAVGLSVGIGSQSWDSRSCSSSSGDRAIAF